MIAGHESEKKNREKKRRKDMGLLEPESEIAHKKKHLTCTQKDEERRVTECGGSSDGVWQRAAQCGFTASTVCLAAPRQDHKPSKTRPPTRPAGTPDGPAGPAEPAAPVPVRPSVPAPQDLARTGPRHRRRTRPPARARLRDLADLPSHQRPHR